jgi:hypothetical protein
MSRCMASSIDKIPSISILFEKTLTLLLSSWSVGGVRIIKNTRIKIYHRRGRITTLLQKPPYNGLIFDRHVKVYVGGRCFGYSV